MEGSHEAGGYNAYIAHNMQYKYYQLNIAHNNELYAIQKIFFFYKEF